MKEGQGWELFMADVICLRMGCLVELQVDEWVERNAAAADDDDDTVRWLRHVDEGKNTDEVTKRKKIIMSVSLRKSKYKETRQRTKDT